jgi:hypothetical protein
LRLALGLPREVRRLALNSTTLPFRRRIYFCGYPEPQR